MGQGLKTSSGEGRVKEEALGLGWRWGWEGGDEPDPSENGGPARGGWLRGTRLAHLAGSRERRSRA